MTTATSRRSTVARYLYADEASQRLVCHEKTVRQMIGREVLHGHHTTGGTRGGEVRIAPGVIEAYLLGASYGEQVTACGCTEVGAPSIVRAPSRRRRHRH